jgi:predicted nucleotidyltransferase
MIKQLREQLINHPLSGKFIYAALSGSHLYGTETPTSDVDVRGVFKADLEDIIFQKDEKVYSFDLMLDGERVDNQFTEFRKFIYDASIGQTYALDILFANPESIIYVDPQLGRLLLKHKDKLLSRNMSAIVHYCINQAKKYTERGKKYNTYKQLQIFLKPFKPNTKLCEIDLVDAPVDIVSKVNKGTGIEEDFISIGNKLFPMNTKVNQLRMSLKTTLDNYGDRVKEAAQQGKDFKALSHAYRLVTELEELWLTGKITFPLKNLEFIKQIKRGEYICDDYGSELHNHIDTILEQPTKLPETYDEDFWNSIIKNAYMYPQSDPLK